MPTYTDDNKLNEKRFDRINYFPKILSKSKHIGAVNFEKDTSREDLEPKPSNNPFHYNPNKDAVLLKKGIGVLKIKKMIGRTARNSIYPDFVAPDNTSTESINKAFKLTQKDSKARGNIEFDRMHERDDMMYKVTEAYKPKRFEIDPNLIMELEKQKKRERMIIVQNTS